MVPPQVEHPHWEAALQLIKKVPWKSPLPEAHAQALTDLCCSYTTQWHELQTMIAEWHVKDPWQPAMQLVN